MVVEEAQVEAQEDRHGTVPGPDLEGTVYARIAARGRRINREPRVRV
jgi:hypothetical protein